MNDEHFIESPAGSDEDFRYDIVWSRHRQRTIGITIERDGRVVVHAPVKTARDALRQLVQEKRLWIKKKLLQVRQEQRQIRPRAFVPGETFLYLGESYPLKVSHNSNGAPLLAFIGGEFRLHGHFKGDRNALFVAWYKKQAERIIRQRVDFYRNILQVCPTAERITSARCQWGGCSAKNTLTFSWRIVLAPLPIVDYVVVHEMAHLTEKNHSPKFWKIVETILPDYRLRRQWLRKHGYLLDA